MLLPIPFKDSLTVGSLYNRLSKLQRSQTKQTGMKCKRYTFAGSVKMWAFHTFDIIYLISMLFFRTWNPKVWLGLVDTAGVPSQILGYSQATFFPGVKLSKNGIHKALQGIGFVVLPHRKLTSVTQKSHVAGFASKMRDDSKNVTKSSENTVVSLKERLYAAAAATTTKKKLGSILDDFLESNPTSAHSPKKKLCLTTGGWCGIQLISEGLEVRK